MACLHRLPYSTKNVAEASIREGARYGRWPFECMPVSPVGREGYHLHLSDSIYSLLKRVQVTQLTFLMTKFSVLRIAHSLIAVSQESGLAFKSCSLSLSPCMLSLPCFGHRSQTPVHLQAVVSL